MNTTQAIATPLPAGTGMKRDEYVFKVKKRLNESERTSRQKVKARLDQVICPHQYVIYREQDWDAKWDTVIVKVDSAADQQFLRGMYSHNLRALSSPTPFIPLLFLDVYGPGSSTDYWSIPFPSHFPFKAVDAILATYQGGTLLDLVWHPVTSESVSMAYARFKMRSRAELIAFLHTLMDWRAPNLYVTQSEAPISRIESEQLVTKLKDAIGKTYPVDLGYTWSIEVGTKDKQAIANGLEIEIAGRKEKLVPAKFWTGDVGQENAKSTLLEMISMKLPTAVHPDLQLLDPDPNEAPLPLHLRLQRYLHPSSFYLPTNTMTPPGLRSPQTNNEDSMTFTSAWVESQQMGQEMGQGGSTSASVSESNSKGS